MSREHLVHFKVIREGETKLLSGLVFLEDGQTEPTLSDFEQCLKQCGHEVQIMNREQFIFKSTKPGDEYIIDILEDYKPNNKDLQADNLARSFIKRNPIL